jgi:peptidyl-Lys metalloendopeptidase
MSKSIRFTWFSGMALGVLLLGACVGVEDADDTSPVDVGEAASEGQDPAAGDVAVDLVADTASFGVDENVTVSIAFTNTARHAVRLLAWQTVAEELEEDLFEVTRDGQPVEYIGPHYKRPAPEKQDFVVLAPGKTLTRTVDLTGFYDLSQTGDYDVRFALELKDQGKKEPVAIESGKVGLFIEGRLSETQLAAGDGTSNLTASVSFNKCTVTQQNTLMSALGAAGTMATNAVTYLNGSPSGTPRYTTWFGAYSLNGWNTAKSHFTAINDVFNTKAIKFDCGCKKTYYAYVYPNSPYSIYLCKAFWAAPLTGTDSKGGTLVHEASHFTVVAGTDDYVYGQAGAKSLASSNPSQALNNADNHEYFAENTPNLQ